MDFLQVGKSTCAKKIAEKYKAIIISTDDLRQELLNDVNNQDNNNLVFEEAENRIKQHLKNKQNVIFDATNINYKRRMEFINKYKKFNVEKIAVLVLTPFEECLERNSKRERKVPEDVIKRMYFNFYIPQYYEGFDGIQITYNTRKKFNIKDLEKELDIPQNNPYHTLSIYKHCEKTLELVSEKEYKNEKNEAIMCYSALLHDIGKIDTKTFINMSGEKTDIAHYYRTRKSKCL